MSDKKTNRRHFWLMILTVLAFCLIPFLIPLFIGMIPEEYWIARHLRSKGCSVYHTNVDGGLWMWYPTQIMYTDAGKAKSLTNEMLELFPKLPHVGYVHFVYTDLGGLDLNPLTEMPGLTSLQFTGCTNLDVGELQKLENCSKLEVLRITTLGKTPVSREDIQAWEKCPLKHLCLISVKLTNDELEAVAELSSLTSLRVEGNAGITDEGLEHLLKLKHLQTLLLEETGVTKKGIEDFRKRHPNTKLEIISDF